MSEPGGWLWAIIGVFGVGGLAVALAYGSAVWRGRRKDSATRREQAEFEKITGAADNLTETVSMERSSGLGRFCYSRFD